MGAEGYRPSGRRVNPVTQTVPIGWMDGWVALPDVDIERTLLATVEQIRVRPRRARVACECSDVSVPMLRGVWGAALRFEDRPVYERVFEGEGPAHSRSPAYLLRPGDHEPVDVPALEWISFGSSLEYDDVLLRAWSRAGGMGLGPERRPFRFEVPRWITPVGPSAESEGRTVWTLGEFPWPIPGDPGREACILRFTEPLRIVRKGVLLANPTYKDLVVAAARRLETCASLQGIAIPSGLRARVAEARREVPAGPWTGERLDFSRYSGRQEAVIDLHGVVGEMALPEGPGALWPLLHLSAWLHLGKGTVFGLGRLRVLPMG